MEPPTHGAPSWSPPPWSHPPMGPPMEPPMEPLTHGAPFYRCPLCVCVPPTSYLLPATSDFLLTTDD